MQLFDPRYHRTSTVQGLEGSGFTPDEIGMIYAANWERDLSQAHPALGNVILAWKSLKVAAFEKRLTEGDIAHFQGSCETVLESALASIMATGSADAFLDATAYGGYQFYEHMDNPEGTPQAAQMKVVLGTKNTSGLPDHMFISREYVKEMLFEAAKLSHPDLAGTPTAAVAASSKATRDALGAGPGTPTAGGIPAGSVAQETSIEVQGQDGGGGRRRGDARPAGVRADRPRVARAAGLLVALELRRAGDRRPRLRARRPHDGDVRRRRQVPRARAQDPRRRGRDRRRDAADRPHGRAHGEGP